MTHKPLVTLLSAALLSVTLLSHPCAIAQAPAAPNAAPPPPADAPAQPSRGYQRQGPPQMSRGDYRSGNSGSGGMGMHPGSRIVPPGEWWKNPDTIQQLSLTADQQKKMDDIMQQHRLKLIDLNAALQKEEALMHPLIEADQPDENKILAQIDSIAQARAELEKANARMLLGIRQVLTPDQWKKLRELRAQGGSRSWGRDGRDGERGNWDRRGPGGPPADGASPQGGSQPGPPPQMQ